MDLDLTKIKKIFFIGIGGIGISALAKFALSRGIAIAGVNDEDSPKTLDPLRDAGAEIVFQKDMQELPEADLYVYSDAWLYRGPDILESAKKTGKPVLSYFQALGIFAREYKVIAISGVHGKTTTTAMIADVLEVADFDPTVVVGSFVKKFESNFRQGEGEYLVVEADEYMRHFLNFQPDILVITNIEADHLDYYKDLADIQKAFSQLIDQTKTVVVCDPNDIAVVEVLKGKNISVVDYTPYVSKMPELSVPGKHNRLDAACALAVSDILEIPTATAEKALAEFQGTWRRLEKRGVTTEGTIVYDDYAHHPTEIRASLQALRELYPKGEKKITVVFQPHLYSRTKALFPEFIGAFDEADTVTILPIYFAREDPDPSVSSEKLAEAVRQHGFGSGEALSFEQAEAKLHEIKLGKNDILVTMGAGEAYKIGDSLISAK